MLLLPFQRLMLLRSLAVIGTTLLTVGCATGAPPRAQQGSASPALVLLITIDQFRADYYDRWGHQFTGGLARLAREGAVFTEAVHDHAITETAPGHATVGSGRLPVHTGIAANNVGVFDSAVEIIGEPEVWGASPHRFRGTSIADWIRARNPRARIVSISMKDRGAILPVGRVAGDVYWYVPSGRFTTSTYYRRDLPRWVRDFNDQRLPQRWAGRAWELLLDEAEYPEPDSVPFEAGGSGYLFPHVLPGDSVLAPQLLPIFPWMDDLTLGLSLQAVRALRLGTSGHTDLLAISLSATDPIGHRFGPDSREVHDQILRLDRALGAFLDTLFTLVDHRQVVIALTADHGVAPLPELTGGQGHRVVASTLVNRLRADLWAAGADTTAIFFGSGALSVERAELERAGVDVDSTVRGFVGFARTITGVGSADLLSELAGRDTVNDYVARRWLHMFAPGGEVEAVVTLSPLSIWSYGSGTTHGSPHDYDARVPLIFWGPQFAAARHATPARTIDLAPTLARAIGVQPSERLDGRVLGEAFR